MAVPQTFAGLRTAIQVTFLGAVCATFSSATASDTETLASTRHGGVRMAMVEEAAAALGWKDWMNAPAQGASRLALWLYSDIAREAPAREQLERLPPSSAAAAAWQWRLVEVAAALGDRHLRRPLEADEETLAAVWPEHQEHFSRRERYRFRQIFVERAEGAGVSARARMEDIQRRLHAEEDFAAIAREASDSTTAARGGLVGWVEVERLVPPLPDVLADLEDGEISPPVELPTGFVIVQRLAHQPPREAQFADSQQRLRRRLLLQRKHREEQWLETTQLLPGATESAAWTLFLPSLPGYTGGTERAVPATLVEAGLAAQAQRTKGTPGKDWEPSVADLEQVKDLLARAEALRLLGGSQAMPTAPQIDWIYRQFWYSWSVRSRFQEQASAPTEELLRAEFESHPERFVRRHDLLHLQAMRLDLREVADPQVADRFRRAAEQARTAGTAQWQRMLEQWNAVSGFDAPDHGWHSRDSAFGLGGAYDTAFEGSREAGTALPLQQQGDSLLIVRVAGRKAAGPLSFDEVKQDLERRWYSRRMSELRRSWEQGQLREMDFRLLGARSAGAPGAFG